MKSIFNHSTVKLQFCISNENKALSVYNKILRNNWNTDFGWQINYFRWFFCKYTSQLQIKTLYIKIYLFSNFVCDFSGESSFDVVWLHNEKEIKNSKDFQYQTEGSDYKLVIQEIFPEDGGIYTCEAFNDAGEAFSSCTLVVLGLYSFSEHLLTNLK